MSSVRVDVVRPAELGADVLATWTALQSQAAGLDHPFLCSDFAVAVGEVRPAARVAVVSDASGIVAFWPFERRRGGRAAPIGAGLSDGQAVIAAQAVPMLEIMRASGVLSWRFDHLVAVQRELLGDRASVTTVDSPIIDLGDGWDAYVADRRRHSKSLIQSTASKRRRLERQFGTIELSMNRVDHGLLDRLIDWKSDQYRRTGRRDRFADDANRQLLHRLLDTSTPGFSGHLCALAVDGAPVAVHFSLRTTTTVSSWFPAYDPAYSRFSPGLILLLDMARSLADEGVPTFDLGRGDEEYKGRAASRSVPLLQGQLDRNRAVGACFRAVRYPRERLESYVLGSDVLRMRARRTLAAVGSVRQRLHELRRRVGPPAEERA